MLPDFPGIKKQIMRVIECYIAASSSNKLFGVS
jgi:hypothetical protein